MRNSSSLLLRLVAVVAVALLCAGPASVAAANCTAAAANNCTACTAIAGCDYCAFRGAAQGTGSCVTSGSCPVSSVVREGACAKPGDTCANYGTTCSSCGDKSPPELNCGWCATGIDGNRTTQCVSGSTYAPNAGSCSTYGWSFQYASCQSKEANCNIANEKMTCGACSAESGCGFCGLTGACEYTPYGGVPAARDCPAASFTLNPILCPGAVDSCNAYSKCSQCLGSASGFACGWCSSANGNGTCSTPNNGGSGPMIGTCPAGKWHSIYDSCPAADSCPQQTTCSGCTRSAACGWCTSPTAGGDGRCMAGTSSGGAPLDGSCPASAWDFSVYDCPTTPTPHTSKDTGMSASNSTTIAFLIITGLAISIFGTLFLLPRFSPVYVAGHSSRDYSTKGMLLLGCFLVVTGLILKITALAVDIWSWGDLTILSTKTETRFGAWSMRTQIIGGASASTTYADQCLDLIALGAYGLSDTCTLAQIGGIFTFVCGLMACMATLLLAALAFVVFQTPSKLSVYVLRMYRVAGLASVLCLSTASFWLFSGWMPLHHMGGQVTLSYSWGIMITAWIVDVAALLFYRAVTKTTPGQLTPVQQQRNPFYATNVPIVYSANANAPIYSQMP